MFVLYLAHVMKLIQPNNSLGASIHILMKVAHSFTNRWDFACFHTIFVLFCAFDYSDDGTLIRVVCMHKSKRKLGPMWNRQWVDHHTPKNNLVTCTWHTHCCLGPSSGCGCLYGTLPDYSCGERKRLDGQLSPSGAHTLASGSRVLVLKQIKSMCVSTVVCTWRGFEWNTASWAIRRRCRGRRPEGTVCPQSHICCNICNTNTWTNEDRTIMDWIKFDIVIIVIRR